MTEIVAFAAPFPVVTVVTAASYPVLHTVAPPATSGSVPLSSNPGDGDVVLCGLAVPVTDDPSTDDPSSTADTTDVTDAEATDTIDDTAAQSLDDPTTIPTGGGLLGRTALALIAFVVLALTRCERYGGGVTRASRDARAPRTRCARGASAAWADRVGRRTVDREEAVDVPCEVALVDLRAEDERAVDDAGGEVVEQLFDVGGRGELAAVEGASHEAPQQVPPRLRQPLVERGDRRVPRRLGEHREQHRARVPVADELAEERLVAFLGSAGSESCQSPPSP